MIIPRIYTKQGKLVTYLNNGFAKAAPTCLICEGKGRIGQQGSDYYFKCESGHSAFLLKQQTHFAMCPFCEGEGTIWQGINDKTYEWVSVSCPCEGRGWLRL